MKSVNYVKVAESTQIMGQWTSSHILGKSSLYTHPAPNVSPSVSSIRQGLLRGSLYRVYKDYLNMSKNEV